MVSYKVKMFYYIVIQFYVKSYLQKINSIHFYSFTQHIIIIWRNIILHMYISWGDTHHI